MCLQVALEELCVEGNKLHYLPVSLWSLRQLQVLNAARNRIEWLRYASSLFKTASLRACGFMCT